MNLVLVPVLVLVLDFLYPLGGFMGPRREVLSGILSQAATTSRVSGEF